jgi:hypothetical protein
VKLVEWKVCGASVLGSFHRAEEIPCQDAHAIRVGADGALGLVVADGAGSARLSHLGSALLAERVAEVLVADPEAPVGGIPGAVKAAISGLRESLARDQPGADTLPEASRPAELRDYAATLVACLLRPSGGLFLQIGDGAGMALDLETPGNNLVSPPENGEYANETYFFTMPSWSDHFRTIDFGPDPGVVLLMSDGVTPLALAKDGSPFMPFVEPVHSHLIAADRDAGDRAIASTLGSEGVDRITGDDRTLVWAARMVRD